MDISRTIPQTENPDWVDSFFKGVSRTEVFPFARTVADVHKDDYLYLIYQGRYYGRLRVRAVDQGRQTIEVGTKGESIVAMTVVHVKCPGERPPNNRDVEANSHRQHRYIHPPIW